MARTIAIAMQKGGVGKTTTTINLAAGLAAMDYRVLAVDLDPQGNLTQHAGFDPEGVSPTIYNVLKAELDGLSWDIHGAVHGSEEGFDLLPSQPELSIIEITLMNALSRERVLTTVLEEIKADYDFILIDCSPSLNLLVINALTAADSRPIAVDSGGVDDGRHTNPPDQRCLGGYRTPVWVWTAYLRSDRQALCSVWRKRCRREKYPGL